MRGESSIRLGGLRWAKPVLVLVVVPMCLDEADEACVE
jgi:hypothetical protein